jgi:hypothetical protein
VSLRDLSLNFHVFWKIALSLGKKFLTCRRIVICLFSGFTHTHKKKKSGPRGPRWKISFLTGWLWIWRHCSPSKTSENISDILCIKELRVIQIETKCTPVNLLSACYLHQHVSFTVVIIFRVSSDKDTFNMLAKYIHGVYETAPSLQPNSLW